MRSLLHGALFNLAFTILIVFAQIRFAPELVEAALTEHTNWLLALVVCLIIILEPIGTWLKLKNDPPNTENLDDNGGFIIIVWIFHTTISSIALMSAFELFGLSLDSGWAAAAFLGNVLKELAILFIVLHFADSKKTLSTQTDKSTQIIVADCILLFVVLMYYITYWQFIVATDHVFTGLTDRIFQGVIIGILFIIYFLPARLAYLVKELNSHKNRREEVVFFLSILLTTVAAVLPVVTR